MDLSRYLEPALFRLFPIRQAASAGPQPAREWKCLAHVIFGKCRVHRNPAAWSPVSARHPGLAITKQRWRHYAAVELKWAVARSATDDNYQGGNCSVVTERKHFLPFCLLKIFWSNKEHRPDLNEGQHHMFQWNDPKLDIALSWHSFSLFRIFLSLFFCRM